MPVLSLLIGNNVDTDFLLHVCKLFVWLFLGYWNAYCLVSTLFLGYWNVYYVVSALFPGYWNVYYVVSALFPGYWNVYYVVSALFPGYWNVYYVVSTLFLGYWNVYYLVSALFLGYLNVHYLVGTLFLGYLNVHYLVSTLFLGYLNVYYLVSTLFLGYLNVHYLVSTLFLGYLNVYYLVSTLFLGYLNVYYLVSTLFLGYLNVHYLVSTLFLGYLNVYYLVSTQLSQFSPVVVAFLFSSQFYDNRLHRLLQLLLFSLCLNCVITGLWSLISLFLLSADGPDTAAIFVHSDQDKVTLLCTSLHVHPVSALLTHWGGLCQGQQGRTCTLTTPLHESDGKVTCTLTNQKVPGRQATVTWIQKLDGEWNSCFTFV